MKGYPRSTNPSRSETRAVPNARTVTRAAAAELNNCFHSVIGQPKIAISRQSRRWLAFACREIQAELLSGRSSASPNKTRMRRPQRRHRRLCLFAKAVCGQREALDTPSGCLWSASCWARAPWALARCPPDARDSVKDANHIDQDTQSLYCEPYVLSRRNCVVVEVRPDQIAHDITCTGSHEFSNKSVCAERNSKALVSRNI